MVESCVFCKIVSGELKADIVYRDDQVTAFRDIEPQAPVHILIVPNEHVRTPNDLRTPALASALFLTATELARREGLADRGYRLAMNSGPEGGQAVQHLHLHLLGGRRMAWPPG